MIRTAIREEQVHYRHRNVAKLLFMHMLGKSHECLPKSITFRSRDESPSDTKRRAQDCVTFPTNFWNI